MSSALLRSFDLLWLFVLGWYDVNLEGDEELHKSFCVFQIQRVILSDLLRSPRLRLKLVAAQGFQRLTDGQLAFRDISELRQAVQVSW